MKGSRLWEMKDVAMKVVVDPDAFEKPCLTAEQVLCAVRRGLAVPATVALNGTGPVKIPLDGLDEELVLEYKVMRARDNTLVVSVPWIHSGSFVNAKIFRPLKNILVSWDNMANLCTEGICVENKKFRLEAVDDEAVAILYSAGGSYERDRIRIVDAMDVGIYVAYCGNSWWMLLVGGAWRER